MSSPQEQSDYTLNRDQIWMFLGSFICFGSIVLSLAEMSSMAPTAGGQYHWVSALRAKA